MKPSKKDAIDTLWFEFLEWFDDYTDDPTYPQDSNGIYRDLNRDEVSFWWWYMKRYIPAIELKIKGNK